MKGFCEGYFKKELVHEDPSKFNQALMDLGEMVCLPNGLPLCENCPFKDYCLSRRDGTMLDYPPAKKAKEKKEENWTVLLLKKDGKYALRIREEEGLLAGLYEFPSYPGSYSDQEVLALLEKEGFDFLSVVPLGASKHVFTHLVWHLQGYAVSLNSLPSHSSFVWASKEEILHKYPLPTAYSFYKKKL